ncbi:MAG TPA: ABC transporter ATP-binding protein [Clostridiales bacterium]|nr:ABC transporter ATP-binding protein [Clostridiales bacterium]
MSVIEIDNLTKDYGYNRGVFDINLNIEQGEMVGFVGTNGSGKTTTIRNIMGFIKPTSGEVRVNGLNAWEHSSEIVKNIGYVPGEIAFPDLKTGVEFLNSQKEFLGLKSFDYANELIERLQLDPRANLKRMSKGMKQKTALVAALMNDAPIIILDEPTTGLDPLMRVTFLDIIKEEHKKGKTIFMSSHNFEELEGTCDRVALINDGHLIDVCDMDTINDPAEKEFKIEFKNPEDYKAFIKEDYKVIRLQDIYNQATIKIAAANTAKLLQSLKKYDVKFISEIPYTLEKHFKEALKNKKEIK